MTRSLITKLYLELSTPHKAITQVSIELETLEQILLHINAPVCDEAFMPLATTQRSKLIQKFKDPLLVSIKIQQWD